MLALRERNANLAAQEFSRVVKLEPTDVGLLFLADALRQAGRPEEAHAAEQLAERSSSNLAAARESVQETYNFFGIDFAQASAASGSQTVQP
jgi:hypothetical protein